LLRRRSSHRFAEAVLDWPGWRSSDLQGSRLPASQVQVLRERTKVLLQLHFRSAADHFHCERSSVPPPRTTCARHPSASVASSRVKRHDCDSGALPEGVIPTATDCY